MKTPIFSFKPGDEVLIDLHIVAKVKATSVVQGKILVSVPDGSGKEVQWHVKVDRCLPNTKAARTLYTR